MFLDIFDIKNKTQNNMQLLLYHFKKLKESSINFNNEKTITVIV